MQRVSLKDCNRCHCTICDLQQLSASLYMSDHARAYGQPECTKAWLCHVSQCTTMLNEGFATCLQESSDDGTEAKNAAGGNLDVGSSALGVLGSVGAGGRAALARLAGTRA
jgi:hypothetical protein